MSIRRHGELQKTVMPKTKLIAAVVISFVGFTAFNKMFTVASTDQGGESREFANKSAQGLEEYKQALTDSRKQNKEDKELEELRFKFDMIEARHKDALTKIKIEGNKTKTCLYQAEYEPVLSEDCKRRLSEMTRRVESNSTYQAATPVNESPAVEQTQELANPEPLFNFPSKSCGDSSSSETEAWYPVFVDNGDLETIRNNYCADAVSTKREDTGVKSVQVASFTSREKALALAGQIGGSVGQPTTPR